MLVNRISYKNSLCSRVQFISYLELIIRNYFIILYKNKKKDLLKN